MRFLLLTLLLISIIFSACESKEHYYGSGYGGGVANPARNGHGKGHYYGSGYGGAYGDRNVWKKRKNGIWYYFHISFHSSVIILIEILYLAESIKKLKNKKKEFW